MSSISNSDFSVCLHKSSLDAAEKKTGFDQRSVSGALVQYVCTLVTNQRPRSEPAEAITGQGCEGSVQL